MKYLRKYNESFENILDEETIKDILLDLTDQYETTIETYKNDWNSQKSVIFTIELSNYNNNNNNNIYDEDIRLYSLRIGSGTITPEQNINYLYEVIKDRKEENTSILKKIKNKIKNDELYLNEYHKILTEINSYIEPRLIDFSNYDNYHINLHNNEIKIFINFNNS